MKSPVGNFKFRRYEIVDLPNIFTVVMRPGYRLNLWEVQKFTAEAQSRTNDKNFIGIRFLAQADSSYSTCSSLIRQSLANAALAHSYPLALVSAIEIFGLWCLKRTYQRIFRKQFCPLHSPYIIH